MSATDNKRYYWLRLQDDFFKRHDIKIVECMPNGKDYIIFYLKLLCESTSHEGRLRFSEEIPYNEEMLATITNTNIDIVRSAIKVLSQLKMIEVLDDGTLYMHQVAKMIGCETGKAKRMRAYRNEQKLLVGSNEPKCSQDIDIYIDKEIDKEDIYKGLSSELVSTLKEFEKMRNKIKAPLTDKAKKMLLNKLDGLAKDDATKIKILDQSILNCWKGIYELKNDNETIPDYDASANPTIDKSKLEEILKNRGAK